MTKRTMTWLAIAVGGALGSLARYAVNHLVHTRWLTTRFPAGTVAVNLLGCFIIGVLAGLIVSEGIGLRLHRREFVFVGLLGGSRRSRRSASTPSCWGERTRWPRQVST